MTHGNLSTIARPYMSAAFEFAAEKKDLAAWEKMLDVAAAVTENEDVARLLASPSVPVASTTGLYLEILDKYLDEPKKNFIRLLAENGRLQALPAIAALFKETRAEQEKVISVEVTSSARLPDAYQQKLINALTKRLQRKVELDCKTDPAILGGAVIRAGDLVIDGSVRGKLTRLFESL
jgi:F-type H+-transporting ATPase subunit delta